MNAKPHGPGQRREAQLGPENGKTKKARSERSKVQGPPGPHSEFKVGEQLPETVLEFKGGAGILAQW